MIFYKVTGRIIDMQGGRETLKSGAAFTLLEVMIAMAFLSIVLTAIFKIHGQTISMNESAEFYSIAPLLAQTKMSEVLATPLNELVDGSGEVDEDYPGYTYTVTVSEVESEYFSDDDALSRFKRIDVVIAQEATGMRYSLRFYRLFNEEE